MRAKVSGRTRGDQSSRALDRRLRILADSCPALRAPAETYGVLIAVVRDARVGVAPVAISAADAADKLSRGEPLLAGATLDFDLGAMRGVAIRLAEALARRGIAKASAVRAALARDRFPLERLLRHAAAGDGAYAGALARAFSVDPAVLDVVARNAVKPALRAWSRQLAPLAGGVPWERGYCFVCGARAALAELTGNELSRRLRCARCGAGWGARRILCPFCGNEDPSSLGFLLAEGRAANARVEVCDGCGEYLKEVAAFDPGSPDDVAVEDLATLPLDEEARARGYTCGAVGAGAAATRASGRTRRRRGRTPPVP